VSGEFSSIVVAMKVARVLAVALLLAGLLARICHARAVRFAIPNTFPSQHPAMSLNPKKFVLVQK
jgi:hypothetical protein